MNILFFADNFPPEVNAAATRVFERALYWVKAGHQVTFVTSVPNFPQGKVYPGYRNRWYQVEYLSGIRVVRVKTFIAKNKGFLLRILDFTSYMITAFFAGLLQKKPDVVCVTSPQFFAAIGAWACAKCRRRPFVFELGDLWPKSIVAVGQMRPGFLLSVLEKLELFLYRQAKKVVALSESFKIDLVSRGISPEKIDVVRNGVDLSRYSPAKKDAALLEQYGLSHRFVVGYIGTHGAAQGLMHVIQAANLLRDKEIVFLFVGDGAEKPSLIEAVKVEKLNNVCFIPPQPKASIKAFWTLCDLALVHLREDPAFSEVIPSKIFEAMAMGLPILFAGPAGEASKIIEAQAVGITLPGNQPALFAETVLSLSKDLGRCQQYAANGRLNCHHFTRKKQADAMMCSLYDATDMLTLAEDHVS